MSGTDSAGAGGGMTGRRRVSLVIAWLWVGIPFVYGLVQLIAKIPALFAV